MNNTDWFSFQGSQHRINQDYVLSGNDYVILSDGCSMAPNSDIGARLLVHSAKQVIKNTLLEDFIIFESIQNAYQYSKTLGVDKDCLAATLLFARKTQNYLSASIAGDGFVVIKNSDGIKCTQIKYPSGAPFYPFYTLDEKLEEQYFNTFGTSVETIEYEFKDSKWEIFNQRLTEYTNRLPTCYDFHCTQDTEWIALFTDGLESFLSLENKETGLVNKSVPPEQVLSYFTHYPSFNGEFVHRRSTMAFKEFHKKSWRNTDDFTIGVLKNN